MKTILILLFLLLPVTLEAKDLTFSEKLCQDPTQLSPSLREAFYQLKELEKQIEGMTVKIRCQFRDYSEEELNKITIKVEE